jgi:superfamily II DNA or RNA helicase
MVSLRSYQSDSLAQLRRGLMAGHLAQVLQMATGGGKTAVASAMAGSAVAKGKRVFFVADSIELVEQAAGRFMADGIEVGIIQGQHWMTDYSKAVQVATIQTLRSRWPSLHWGLYPDLLIVDECHVLHRAHEKIIRECKHKRIPVIGLSATPFRAGMGELFDSLVVGATTERLTREGYLVPAKCYAPFVPDLTGVKTTTGGDWQEDALAEVMGDAHLVGDVVDHWMRHARDRKTIVFAANVAHSKQLRDEFCRRGVVAAHIDGYMRDPQEREQMIRSFRSGDTEVICNVAVLTKGFDAPETSCIVLARPTKSLMLHTQMVGRGLRVGGHQDCLILDHAGNVLRNGLPTDPLPSELDDGQGSRNLDRREKPERKDMPCVSCGYVSNLHKCPMCGFAPERRADVEVVHGELVEVTETPNAAAKRNRAETRKQKAEFYGGLLTIERERGYKRGWASHAYRKRYGVWPNAHKSVSPCEVIDDVRSWDKYLRIQNAKRRAA